MQAELSRSDTQLTRHILPLSVLSKYTFPISRRCVSCRRPRSIHGAGLTPAVSSRRSAWHCTSHSTSLVIRSQPPIPHIPPPTGSLHFPVDSAPVAALSVPRCSYLRVGAPSTPPIAPSPTTTNRISDPHNGAHPRIFSTSMSAAAATTNNASNAVNAASNSGRQLKMSTSGKGIDAQRKPGSPIDGGQR